MEMEAAVAQQLVVHRGGLMGREVVQYDPNVQLGGNLAGGDLQGREEVAGAVPLVVVGGPCRCGGQHGRCGGRHGQYRGSTVQVRSSAWVCGFSSMANTAALTGGSCTARPGRGSSRLDRDTLKLSVRHDSSPRARQISPTVAWLMPCLAARPRVDHERRF